MSALDSLLRLLDLEPLEQTLFRGQSQSYGATRVFGGQVLAQALVAAGRTVEPERRCHSLHAYFILPGDAAAPILYQVDRLRDGGSFATRRVVKEPPSRRFSTWYTMGALASPARMK